MRFDGISRSFGDRVLYQDFSIDFADRSVTAILGPSGCGKTTLLNELALRSRDRAISFVFQEPRLIPWRTLSQNLAFAIGGPKRESILKAEKYLERVGLGDRARAYPENLSGGERQRVSIARAFAVPSPMLLMDEPFQSQDPSTKAQLIALIRKIQDEEKRIIVIVTHDVREAVAIADRAILLKGRPVSIALDLEVTDSLESDIADAKGYESLS